MIKKQKVIAFGLSVSMLITNANVCFASNNNEECYENMAAVMEDYSGVDSINTDTYSDKDSIAIADGEEIIVDIPRSGNDSVVMDDGEGCVIEMQLPDEAGDDRGHITDNGTIVYGEEDETVVIGVQPLKEEENGVSFEGVRTLITINDNSASKEYDFVYDLPAGCQLVTCREYFESVFMMDDSLSHDEAKKLANENDTGEVFIVDEMNQIISVIEAAWAYDANGDAIETYYKTNGCTLTQVVNFDETTAFPVIADPSAWQIARCASALTILVGGTVCAGVAVVKAVKWVKALGGVWSAAKLMVMCFTRADVLRYAKTLGSTVLSLATMILGIDDVLSYCRF